MLPLSVYGAVAMAHSDVSEEYSSPYQFFFYLYDKRNVSRIKGTYWLEGLVLLTSKNTIEICEWSVSLYMECISNIKVSNPKKPCHSCFHCLETFDSIIQISLS